MDYTISFGMMEKIYRIDEQDLSICQEKHGSILPKETIAWKNILGAGEGVMTSPAYQKSRDVGRILTEALPHGKHPAQFKQMQVSTKQITGYIILTYTNTISARKKVRALPMNISAPIRRALLDDLSTYLGDRWYGENLDPSDLKNAWESHGSTK